MNNAKSRPRQPLAVADQLNRQLRGMTRSLACAEPYVLPIVVLVPTEKSQQLCLVKCATVFRLELHVVPHKPFVD